MKKILLIEDDEKFGASLPKKLRDAGYESDLELDGLVGFSKLISWKPDLLLLDLKLPNKNGFEILSDKDKNKEIRDIPVIVISNSVFPEEINKALTLGASDYIAKNDFDEQDLLQRISRILKNEVSYESTPDNAPSGGAPLSGQTIMWVEDDRFLSDIIARKLGAQGCRLVHAVDGESAMKSLRKSRPDLILLDILLSGLDGFEILKELKSSADTHNIPVILLSNLSQKADIEKGKSLGAARFLVKATVSLDEIIEEIKRVLQSPKPSPVSVKIKQKN